MKIGSEDFSKVKKIISSPAAGQVLRWSRCVHGRMLCLCLMRTAVVLCSLGVTLVTRDLIDAAVSARPDALWRSGGLMLALVLAGAVLRFASSLLRTRASARLRRSMQSTLVREILTKEFASLRRYHSGELVNRVFSDTDVIRNGVLNILPGIVGMAVSFAGAAAILIALDWRFLLLLACGGVIGTVIVLLFRRPMKERHIRMQQAGDRLHAIIQETFENIRLIKASLSENRVFRQVDRRQETLEQEQIRQGKFSAVMNNSMGLMFEFSWLICMLWGGAAIYRGNLTYGALAAMIQLIGRVQSPLAGAVDIAGDVYRVIASAERLMELTGLPAETTGPVPEDFDEIVLDRVSFRYEDESEEVLSDVSGTIRKGEFIALTGPSGGGKTTLFQLLLGIYSPTAGSIIFRNGGTEMPACRECRALFAYVPQGNTLFSGTLRENLLMFTDSASEEEIRQALKAACLDDLAEQIGLDAELGERGTGLSEGQAQRVAVARALLTGAPILLLDEATSALDMETEARMLRNIAALRDKTVLIVTHRHAALSLCSHRLRIAGGRMEKQDEQECFITVSPD